jgi:hypothetical protein
MSEITIKQGHLKPTSSKEVVIEDGDWEVSVWVHDGKSIIADHWDSRYMTDKAGAFMCWHGISGITLGYTIDDIRWYDIVD